jgi:hypothetical protein
MLEMHSGHVRMFQMNCGVFQISNLLIVLHAVTDERSVARLGGRAPSRESFIVNMSR